MSTRLTPEPGFLQRFALFFKSLFGLGPDATRVKASALCQNYFARELDPNEFKSVLADVQERLEQRANYAHVQDLCANAFERIKKLFGADRLFILFERVRQNPSTIAWADKQQLESLPEIDQILEEEVFAHFGEYSLADQVHEKQGLFAELKRQKIDLYAKDNRQLRSDLETGAVNKGSARDELYEAYVEIVKAFAAIVKEPLNNFEDLANVFETDMRRKIFNEIVNPILLKMRFILLKSPFFGSFEVFENREGAGLYVKYGAILKMMLVAGLITSLEQFDITLRYEYRGSKRLSIRI